MKGKVDRRRCICYHRIEVKGEPEKEVFATCKCSRNCRYCHANNIRPGGII